MSSFFLAKKLHNFTNFTEDSFTMSLKLKISHQSKIIIRIILLLSLVLAYMLPDRLLKENDKRLAQIIEQQLMEDQEKASNIAIDLQETLLINGKSAFQQKAIAYQNKYREQFAFFLYENDSLSLWTDNHIPIPALYSEIQRNKELQKLGAYQVLIHHHSFYQFDLVYAQIIVLDYPWENDYLKDHLAHYFPIEKEVKLTDNDGIPIFDKDGVSLFQIAIVDQPSSKNGGTDFFLFLAGFFVLFSLLSHLFELWNSKSHFFKSIVFAAILLIWYGTHYALAIPTKLFASALYSPSLYAFQWVNNNLGNLFFISLILFFGIIYYVRKYIERSFSIFNLYLFIALLMGFLYFIIYLIRSLVMDSQIFMDLYQLASLNFYSYLTLWIIFILQLSWILLAYRWMSHFVKQQGAEKHIWIALLFLGLIPLFFYGRFSFQLWTVQLMGSVGILMVYYLQQRDSQRRLMEVITYLVFFTLITALVLNDLNRQKERQFREISAMNLEMENDPYLESYYLANVQRIQNDTHLIDLVRNSEFETFDDSLYVYITQKYFDPYLGVYNVNLIHCDAESQISVPADDYEGSCYKYFEERIQSAKSVIKKDVFYLIEGDFQYRHYIGRISMKMDSLHKSCIFIEFVSKIKQQESGLPAILEKAHELSSPLLRKYSYAYYKNGELHDWRGAYDYRQKLSDYHLISYHDSFFVQDGFQHYIYSNKPGSVLMISLVKPGILQKLASFAFVFLFYSLLTFLLYSFFSTSSLQLSFSNFQGRLQYSMIVLLLFSFVLIGISSLYYIIYLNKQKNADGLMEKAHSVLIELEHKLSGMDHIDEDDIVYVETLLAKFSEVFFTDITLYSRDGQLLASSRPEVFQSDLLSDNMNANAYYQLNSLKNSFFIQDEQIGSQKYLSAYLPFRNQNNQSLAFLNLPYFAKQYELENEVSGFIVAFLNIYLFLLLIAILITILISRYLSRPLLIIKDKISKLNLQEENEKIEWAKNDEIGDLIKEYNRMVEELHESAHKLAISQRESAWREMAQQIAHEIKNPLTPMKLNVQYLERAWDDGVDDFEERMKKITKALKEQIDVLSEIAGQFSTFAAIEKISPEYIDLEPLIQSVMSVFKVNESIDFQGHVSTNGQLVFMDKNQIIRILNNIYKNAVQALGQQESPQINTVCKVEGNHILIAISDNGIGIAEHEISRIFEPRFTTKSSGMGLGLALVKKMLENSNATIQAQSEESKGTTFTISIPISQSST